MTNRDNFGSPDRLAAFLTLLNRLGSVLGSIIDNRTAQVLVIERREVRRAAKVFALAFVAAIFACAASGLSAVAVVAALGNEHRVAGFALVAAGFAVLSAIAVLLVRGSTKSS